MKRLVLALTICLGLLLPAGVAAAYNPLNSACKNPDGTVQTDSAVCNSVNQQTTTGDNPVQRTILTAANIVAMLTGVAAVGLIMGSGIMMMTSGGNSEKTKKARSMLTSAVVGVVIVALSWTIVHFVITRLIK